MTSQAGLFGDRRLRMDESLDLTVASLREYGPRHDHWALAWSGGKDSTALVTVVLHLLDSGRVDRPKRLTVLYADTRMELLPLWAAAQSMQAQLVARGVDVRVVMAPLDRRFFVYMLGRGVPPPNNATLRWCTRQLKIDPMALEVAQIGEPGERVLLLTGVRQGESAIRDGRIAMSCGANDAECGQGWYQTTLDGDHASTLAPLLHWRVCHVWDWLRFFAPSPDFGGWPTALLAEAYGGEEAEEANARTGCVGCPLVTRDRALEEVVRLPAWGYLRPLLELRTLYTELRLPEHRLRQPGGERRKDGTLATNQQRMGPLTMTSRRMALARVLEIQARVNAARLATAPELDLLSAAEVARIEELIHLDTWPRGWTGRESVASDPFEQINPDGSRQPLLTGLLTESEVAG